MYVGDPPERVDVPAGGVIYVGGGTPLQSANHGDEDMVVCPSCSDFVACDRLSICSSGDWKR